MKIEIKAAFGPGYNATILENGEKIKGIREALISLKPDRLPTIITEETLFDKTGRPIISGDRVASRFVVYYPGEFSIEA